MVIRTGLVRQTAVKWILLSLPIDELLPEPFGVEPRKPIEKWSCNQIKGDARRYSGRDGVGWMWLEEPF
jgi:hypothetical protein